MPSIPPEQRATYIKPLGVICHACRQEIIRNYCRKCDEFYQVCGCPHQGEEHTGHRVYVWTDLGVRAVPDFDHLDDLSAGVLDEDITRAVARVVYESETGRDWHTAESDPGLDPQWRAKVPDRSSGWRAKGKTCGELVDGQPCPDPFFGWVHGKPVCEKHGIELLHRALLHRAGDEL